MMDNYDAKLHPHTVNPRLEKSAVDNDLTERLKRAEEALRTRELNFQRMEAQLAVEKRVLEMVASGGALPDVLGELCQFVATTYAGCQCCIYLLNGSAPNFSPQWSTSIHARDARLLGTLVISQPDPPTQEQLDLITQVTRIASIAIERALSEAALKRSEAFLAEAQHLTRIGSFSWNVEKEEITWSEQLYRIFEFDPQTTVTLELIATRVHPEDLAMLHDMTERARNGLSDFQYEHRLLMPDLSIKHLHLIAHRTRNEEGKLEYIGAVHDVTPQRLSEEALSKARSELAHVARVMSLGALTASIAHEVNQPLSGIITNASTCMRMLGADPPNIDGARETVRRTIRDGRRASDVITRLRALFTNRDEATELVDLNQTTREVITLSLSELHRNRVILKPELANDLPHVTGDRVQLQQVILNLLRNASDAMSAVEDRPRQLVIKTEREANELGGRVRLSVQDTGVGLELENINKLFDAFYTTKNDGMGIGLSVSRSIIESHDGTLWATPNDGAGATFSFSIPSAQHSDDTALTDQQRAARQN